MHLQLDREDFDIGVPVDCEVPRLPGVWTFLRPLLADVMAMAESVEVKISLIRLFVRDRRLVVAMTPFDFEPPERLREYSLDEFDAQADPCPDCPGFLPWRYRPKRGLHDPRCPMGHAESVLGS